MNPMRARGQKVAFTLVELLVIIVVISLLAALLLPQLANAKKKASIITCNNCLKQIGLSFPIFANDHSGTFPMGISTNKGGSLEYLAASEMFRHFQVMSNELSTPVILICPADIRKAAKSFSVLSNTNISYFVGVDANDRFPQSLLAGDRNLMTNGIPVGGGLLILATSVTVGWTAAMHNGAGNVALGDGSVQQLNSKRSLDQLAASGVATNRLAIP
jgi:prepilin-type processing-associated H-X9-DG protein